LESLYQIRAILPEVFPGYNLLADLLDKTIEAQSILIIPNYTPTTLDRMMIMMKN
jgi:hypothetical protein